MVRAIIEGRKTQTRRVMKCQPRAHYTEIAVDTYSSHAVATYRAFPNAGTARWGICRCPYGTIGDQLWVRETFGLNDDREIIYRATDPTWDENSTPDCPTMLWKPSIFMRRIDSRIKLEITDIRVQRVTEINAEDALAEGVDATGRFLGKPKCAFAHLWDSINAKRGLDFESNPWVWVITFKVIDPCPKPGR